MSENTKLTRRNETDAQVISGLKFLSMLNVKFFVTREKPEKAIYRGHVVTTDQTLDAKKKFKAFMEKDLRYW